MSYIITVCEDVQNNMIVDISKKGNRYTVNLWHRATGKSAHKEFDNLQGAFELFTEMSQYFVYGLYTIQDRFEKFRED